MSVSNVRRESDERNDRDAADDLDILDRDEPYDKADEFDKDEPIDDMLDEESVSDKSYFASGFWVLRGTLTLGTRLLLTVGEFRV